jgi:Holliday junction resolvase-like predicted endonuclease
MSAKHSFLAADVNSQKQALIFGAAKLFCRREQTEPEQVCRRPGIGPAD